ncbi:uncharacterized protein LOC134452216 [Engraulis encrasicolus]|uniref:uncharacterized protein LOC134452216 n=1 Tax=Engraulis encrasicolus TaxID=184585 RepID=UPI002FD42EE5
MPIGVLCPLNYTDSSPGDRIIHMVPGGDVAVRCEDSESGWSPLRGNSIELKLGNTAHLLVQNFDQEKDKGVYRCSTGKTVKEVTLEQSGSASSTTLLYRTLGQSSHLFCKVLMRDPCGGVWSRTVHGPLGFVPERTKTKGEDNDFSLQIASVKSEDAGTFKCDIKCTWLHSISFYELIVVHATVDPQRVSIGGNVTMCCTVSHWKTPGQVCWVKLDSNNNSQHYHGHQERCWLESQPSFCHQVSDMKPGDTSWACAVFHDNTLRALVPVQVNVSKHTTTPEPTTQTIARPTVTTVVKRGGVCSIHLDALEEKIRSIIGEKSMTGEVEGVDTGVTTNNQDTGEMMSLLVKIQHELSALRTVQEQLLEVEKQKIEIAKAKTDLEKREC